MANESYLQDLQYQGRSLEQWVKAFNGEFTSDSILNMIRAGADLNKMLMMGLDEAENLTPYEGLPGEQEMMFEDEASRSIKDYMMPNCQIRIFDDDGNEIFWSWIDVKYLDVVIPYIGTGVCGSNNLTNNSVQAGAFIPDNGWQKYEGQTLTTFIYVDGEPLSLDHRELAQQIKDVEARAERVYKNAIVPAKIRKYNQEHAIDEVSHEDEMAAFDESVSDVNVTVGDFKKNLDRNLAKDSDKIMFRVNKKAYEVFQMSGKGGTFVIDLIPAMANENDSCLNESIIPKFIVRVKARGLTMNFTSTADTKDKAEEEIRNQLKKLLKDTNAKIDVEDVTSLKKEKIDESTAPNFSVHVKIGKSEHSFPVNAKNEEDAQWQVLDKLMKKFKTLENVTIVKIKDLKDGSTNVNPFVDE